METPVYLSECIKVHVSHVFAEIIAAFGTRPNRTFPDALAQWIFPFIACIGRCSSVVFLVFGQPQHELWVGNFT